MKYFILSPSCLISYLQHIYNINVGSCLFTCFATSDLILYHFPPQDKYGLTFLMLDVSGFEVDLRNTMRRDIKV